MKRKSNANERMLDWSRPAGARGLKPPQHRRRAWRAQVAPRGGARIETAPPRAPLLLPLVAPRGGARIETLTGMRRAAGA